MHERGNVKEPRCVRMEDEKHLDPMNRYLSVERPKEMEERRIQVLEKIWRGELCGPAGPHQRQVDPIARTAWPRVSLTDAGTHANQAACVVRCGSTIRGSSTLSGRTPGISREINSKTH